jgi:thymidylate synthase (FAD)
MRETHPTVHLIGRPQLDWDAMARYLEGVGGTAWLNRVRKALDPPESVPEGERLVEFMGRLCYRSWAPGLNPNVRKVREDSSAYLDNILRSAHGSVLEHVNYSFVFADVSRVFTHELVRHRAGTAISQESLRFVRLTDIPFEHPEYVRNSPVLKAAAEELLELMARFQELTAQETGIDRAEVDFHTKKTITSAARRYAPDGVATTIGWTANVRTLRHVIASRTEPSAEEEMRRVFDQVGSIMRAELPGLFADFMREPDGTWRPRYRKV